MYNPLIDELFRRLPDAGIAALRYNFRGVGGSSGAHDEGVGERQDAAAAFRFAADQLAARNPHTAGHAGEQSDGEQSDGEAVLLSVGWSFGGDVSLAADHPQLDGWVAVAAPLRIVETDAMAAPSDPRPKLLLVPEHDQFRSPTEVQENTANWENTRISQIAGGDHFLMGHAGVVVERVVEFANNLRTQAN